jgi:TonB family protein
MCEGKPTLGWNVEIYNRGMPTSFHVSNPPFAKNAKDGAPPTPPSHPQAKDGSPPPLHVGCLALLVLFLAPAALSQTPEEFLHSLIGQKLILRHVGDQTGTKVKKKDLAKVKGDCDEAVQVRDATWKQDSARFKLEDIGTPQVQGAQNSCKRVQDGQDLEISKFDANESVETLSASVGQILQTPEQYLAARGVNFDLPLAPDDAPVSKAPPPVTQPKLRLSVDAVYSETARREKFQGTVVLGLIVGTDGRVHRAKVTRGAGHGLDENALRVISMWRFEPARQLDKPVATSLSIQMSFNLY